MTRRAWNYSLYCAGLKMGVETMDKGGKLPWYYYLPTQSEYFQDDLDKEANLPDPCLCSEER